MVPSNPIYKCSYDILASTICHCKHFLVENFCFYVPASINAYSTGCVYYNKMTSFVKILRKLEKGIFKLQCFGLCHVERNAD